MGSAQGGLTSAFDAFHEGLREFGWTENENIAIEYRWAGDSPHRLPALAADLVRLKVDVIIGSTPGVRAAQHATTSIPIIMCIADDAVKEGIVPNLARPGGNITGMTSFASELAGKRLELLREATPRVARVAFLWNPPGSSPDYVKYTQIAARSLGVTLQPVEIRTADDFERAFASVLKGRAEALVVGSGQFLFTHQRRVVEFTLKNRLPSIYAWKDPVSIGGLIAYGVNIPQVYRRAAYYVDRILRGTKAGDLAVERPTKFEMVINLKTARALGLTIPQSVLGRAIRSSNSLMLDPRGQLLTVVLALGLVLAPLVAETQPAGKVWRIGMLWFGSSLEDPPTRVRLDAFQQGLRDDPTDGIAASGPGDRVAHARPTRPTPPGTLVC